MSEYSNLITESISAAPVQAATTVDDNPDNAARAMELEQSTGTPSAAIYGDLDGFERQHKMNLAADIVRGNRQLSDYVDSHPLASTVSNDDWGNLDKFSQGAMETGTALRLLNPITSPKESATAAGAALSEGIEGVKEGFGTQPFGSWLPEGEVPGPIAAALRVQYSPIEAIFRGLSGGVSGVVGATHGAAKSYYQSVTGDASGAERFARDIAGMAEYELNFGQGVPHVAEAGAVRQAAAEVNPAMVAARPWLEQGLEPPTGLHPDIDAAKANINSAALARLDEDLANAQESLTRERSPEMFQKFVEQHYGESTIGINGDAVAALYGDKSPIPEDGLLGWVPGIEDQLALARETGADVHIPVKDWVSRIDPQIASTLHDDIRMWPGGVTAREAADVVQPKAVIDGPLPATRASSSLEPMFAVGDRKLQLVKSPIAEEGVPRGWASTAHPGFEEFHILDENQQKVGELSLITDPENRQLFVAMVNGVAGQWANSFGPSLVRDLKRQLKTMYPDYDTITGHRVTGARLEAAGGQLPQGEASFPVVKLSLNDIDTVSEFHDFQDVIEQGWWQQWGPNFQVAIKPTELFTEHEQAISDAIESELDRIAGRDFEYVPAHALYMPKPGINVLGGFLPFANRPPAIFMDLFSRDPIGVARHEAIHYLRNYGFFKPKEWAILEKAARDEGWIQRYGIDRGQRGEVYRPEMQLEESVAEAYRDWASLKDTDEARSFGETPVTRIFQKIQDLWEGIKSKIAEIIGHEPTYDELFEKIHSGQVADRGPGEPLHPGAFDVRASVDPERFENLRANALGLDLPSYRRLQEHINARYEEDLEAARARAEKEQAKRQGREWRENRIDLRKDVETTIRQRPDVAADLFVGSGELYGQKLRQRYPLDVDGLTAEQKAALPDHYYSKNGLPPDEVAHMFGYGSGDAMIARMIDYNAQKEGRTPQEMLRKVVEDETDRQMEARYGQLGENIMDAAKDQALSETNLNLLAEELYAAGMRAGQPVVDKAVAQAAVAEEFSKIPLSGINSDRFMAQMAKHGRDAERALIGGDPVSAIQSLQKKLYSALLAAEARKLEKERVAFDKLAKQMSRREVSSMDPEYTNFVHQILTQIGKPVRRSAEDLQRQIEAGNEKTLEEFVDEKTQALREIPVYPQLLDPAWKKPYQSLSVAEFRAIRDSVKALVFNGRDELKITKAGEAADLADIKNQMMSQLRDFPAKHGTDPSPQRMGPMKIIRTYVAAHLQMENILNRWDRFDPKGVWNQYVMRDLIEGANQEDAWRKEYAAKLRQTKDKVDLSRSVDNTIFRRPTTGDLFAFNRGNLRTVLLNAGNDSNLAKLAGGYKLRPDDVKAWLAIHATKEDWDWAQKIWDIFEEIKDKSDTMYRGLTGGVAPESIPIKPVETPHGIYRGGYYPIIFHSEFEGASKKLMGRDALEQDNYVRATTPAGYTQRRTNYQAPLALDIDQLPNRIGSMLHDVALRPAVLNASKIFYDKDIRSTIAAHYGAETRDLLVPYLRDVANSSNAMSKEQTMFARASEFIRQNLITTLVGLNPGTVMKHGPTALVLSIKEVGAPEFARAAAGLFSKNEATGESNWQFAMKNSLELQRRDRNWQETLYGASNELVPGQKFMPLRQKIMELSSKPVAMSDMLSAVPTWLASYTKEMEEGATHGDAVYMADRSVRRAHGSTAITNRPSVMRNANPWLTSVYNFFNDVMNRQAETIWKAGDAFGEVKEGNYDKAMAAIPGIAGGLFAYVLWPALVEEMVSPTEDKPDTPWAVKAGKAIAHSVGASWIGVRDLANAIVNFKDPSIGLWTTAGKEITDIARDFHKDDPLGKAHFGRILRDALGLAGLLTGAVPAQVGKGAQFGYNVGAGLEHPRGPWAWLTGLRYGTTKGHPSTFENYMRGRPW